ncbi:MAG: hypothetical protein ACXAB7_04345 [Candidatus Kariarchaeaceae archaeon]|jgi:hypothetical protein
MMPEQAISDYVTVIIDEDEDVHIIDNFLERTENILPKEEAVEVAKYILEILGDK